MLVSLAAAVGAHATLWAQVVSEPRSAATSPLAREPGTQFTGAAAGAGVGTRALGGLRHHDVAYLSVHHGWMLSDEWAPQWWTAGRWLFLMEGNLGVQHRPNRASLVGVTPLARYLFSSGGTVHPFLQAGFGVAWTDIGLPDLGGKLQFAPQGGAGVIWFSGEPWALTAEYRLIHYSNAGLRTPNAGVNVHGLFFGVSVFH